MNFKKHLALLFFLIDINLFQAEKVVTPVQRNIQWPVKTKKGNKISSTFAESRYDHFHNGLDIPVYNEPVHPVQDAEVVWIKSPIRRLNEVDFGGGNMIILKHKKLWSGYMHLKELKPVVFSQGKISTESVIGFYRKNRSLRRRPSSFLYI